MYKTILFSVAFLLLSLRTLGGKSDSLRYFFKASAIAGYGLETFNYNGSHGYITSYRRDNYGYSGFVQKNVCVAQKYGAEVKFDCELPLGIKFVNGFSYNTITFNTPEYTGSYGSEERPEVIYTYKINEKINLETAHVFFGLGYGRKIRKLIWDADVSVDFYKMRSLVMDRSIVIDRNPGLSPVPVKYVLLQAQTLDAYGPLMGIKGSATISYKILKCLYARAGLVYWHGTSEREVKDSAGDEHVSAKFNSIQSLMINLGFSLSVR